MGFALSKMYGDMISGKGVMTVLSVTFDKFHSERSHTVLLF